MLSQMYIIKYKQIICNLSDSMACRHSISYELFHVYSLVSLWAPLSPVSVPWVHDRIIVISSSVGNLGYRIMRIGFTSGITSLDDVTADPRSHYLSRHLVLFLLFFFFIVLLTPCGHILLLPPSLSMGHSPNLNIKKGPQPPRYLGFLLAVMPESTLSISFFSMVTLIVTLGLKFSPWGTI